MLIRRRINSIFLTGMV